MRVGIIGAGTIAHYAHFPGYQKVPGVEIVAISDIDAARAETAKARWNIPASYTDYRQMLKLGLDAVSICTPNYLHAEMTIAALEAGCHVLCEKPMAMNAGEAEQMVTAARNAGKFLMIGFNNRFRADAMALKKLIGQGLLGEIYFAKAGWVRRRGIPGHGNWFTTRAKSGGGALIDIGVHMLDLAVWLMGRPQPVAVMGATYAKFGPRPGRGTGSWGEPVPGGIFDVDDLAGAMIRFTNGATLLLEASWAAHIEKEHTFVHLLGTEAGAQVVSPPAQAKVFTEKEGVSQDITLVTPEQPSGAAHHAEIAAFVRCIKEGVPPESSGEDGLRIMRILDAIYRSAETGTAVRVD